MFWLGLIAGILLSGLVFMFWYTRQLENDIKVLDGALGVIEVQKRMIAALKRNHKAEKGE